MTTFRQQIGSKHITVETKTPAKVSIIQTINKNLVLLFLVVMLILAPLTYLFTAQQINQNAAQKLFATQEMIAAVRAQVREDNSDYFIKRGEWHATAVSPIVAAKSVAKRYLEKNNDTSIRFVSDNPLNYEDLPTPQETNILLQLRASKTKNIITSYQHNGHEYLVYASPEVVKPACLACHGAYDKAPAGQRTLYSGGIGYDWTVGETVGATIIGVKKDSLVGTTLERTAVLAGFLAVVLLVLLGVLRMLLQRVVIARLQKLTDHADKILTNQAVRSLPNEHNDEIGAVGNVLSKLQLSFNLMRSTLRRHGTTGGDSR
jgi:HAMP domain-containing protein